MGKWKWVTSTFLMFMGVDHKEPNLGSMLMNYGKTCVLCICFPAKIVHNSPTVYKIILNIILNDIYINIV